MHAMGPHASTPASFAAALVAAAGIPLIAPLAVHAQAEGGGACCIGPVGECQVMTQPDCTAASGIYRGNGTSCATTVCLRYVQTLRGSGSAAGIGQFIDFRPDNSVLIKELDYFVTTGSAPLGAPLILDVWVHDGTYREAESYDPEKWTLHDTLNGISVGGGSNVPVRVALNTPILVQGGRTKALFLHTRQGTMHFRANTERNPSLYSNGEAELYSERYRFGTGGGGWNGNLTTARDFMGAIYYEPADENVTGACCLPDGTCQPMTLAACSGRGGEGGIFRLNATCASVTCEHKGACCLPDGACLFLYLQDCTRRLGTWAGPGINCWRISCPQPGACCFTPDATGAGGCAMLRQDQCITAGGIFVDGACSSANCTTAPVLWNNGPIETHPLESQIQPGNVLFGANAYRIVLNIPGGFTLADDFVVSDPGGWRIDEVTLFGHRNSTTGSTFSRAYLEIWSGHPADPASSIAFGDQVTDRLIDATPTGVHRFLAGSPNTNRQIYALRLAANATLSPGHYWLRWSVEVQGNEAIANQSPFVTVLGARAPILANAVQSLGGTPPSLPSFHPILDDVNLPLVQQELPFIIKGERLGGCYANCDGSTIQPILNVADFSCFLGKFAAGDPYANCDGSTIEPVLNVADFSCFLGKFAAGCR
jgi:hypothetical protein